MGELGLRMEDWRVGGYFELPMYLGRERSRALVYLKERTLLAELEDGKRRSYPKLAKKSLLRK
jgi:hypothetical protein